MEEVPGSAHFRPECVLAPGSRGATTSPPSQRKDSSQRDHALVLITPSPLPLPSLGADSRNYKDGRTTPLPPGSAPEDVEEGSFRGEEGHLLSGWHQARRNAQDPRCQPVPPAPGPAVPVPREQREGLSSFPTQVRTTGSLAPSGGRRCSPDRGADGRRTPGLRPGLRGEGGKTRGGFWLQSLARLPAFSPRGVGSHGSGSPCPPPPRSPRGRGPAVPTENGSARRAGLARGQGSGPGHLGTRTAASKSQGPGALSPPPPGYPPDPEWAGGAGPR